VRLRIDWLRRKRNEYRRLMRGALVKMPVLGLFPAMAALRIQQNPRSRGLRGRGVHERPRAPRDVGGLFLAWENVPCAEGE
jgi:hypothetical protein